MDDYSYSNAYSFAWSNVLDKNQLFFPCILNCCAVINSCSYWKNRANNQVTTKIMTWTSRSGIKATTLKFYGFYTSAIRVSTGWPIKIATLVCLHWNRYTWPTNKAQKSSNTCITFFSSTKLNTSSCCFICIYQNRIYTIHRAKLVPPARGQGHAKKVYNKVAIFMGFLAIYRPFCMVLASCRSSQFG